MPSAQTLININEELERLKAENALLQGMIHGASDAVYAKDLDGRYLIVNQAAADYFQKDIASIIGKTDVELVGDAGVSIMQHDQELFKTGKPVHYESRGTFDVGNRSFSTTKSPFKNEKGEMVGLVGISRDITETRLAEEKYQFIFENAPIAFWEEDFSEVKKYLDELKSKGITDFKGHFKSNSESLEKCIELIKVTNVNRSTLAMHVADGDTQKISQVGRNFTKESEKVFLEEFVALANGATSYQTEASIVNPAGDVLHVIFNLNVLPGHEEALSLVLISVVDVTESRTIKSELSTMRHRYQSIVEAQTEMICRIDPKGRVQFRNIAFKRFFDFKDQGEKTRFCTLFPPAELEKAEKDLQSLTARNPSISREYRNFDKDGTLVWQEWALTAFYGKSGILLGYQAVGTDVTSRKMAQEALAASETRWRSVIENADDIIMTLNAEGYILSINKNIDLPEDVKWTGRTIEEVMLPENAPRAMNLLNKVFSTARPLKTEIRLKRRAGGYSTFGLAISPVFSGKRVITVVCIARNITEHKEVEKQTREALIQGQENERLRVSRELHDGLGQLVTAITLDTTCARHV